MKTEKLQDEIEAVFPFVEKPKGIALSFHKYGCDQCRFLRDDLSKYTGKELPPEAIRSIHQEMSCLSEQGWRWALPSYLRYCLTQEAWYGEMETEFLIYNFFPGLKHHADTIKRLSALTARQIQCLIHFLEWCQENEYWGQYCPEEISSGIDFLSTIKAKQQ